MKKTSNDTTTSTGDKYYYLRQMLKKVSPGPWGTAGKSLTGAPMKPFGYRRFLANFIGPCRQSKAQALIDVRFCADVRNLLADLLAEYDEMKEKLGV